MQNCTHSELSLLIQAKDQFAQPANFVAQRSVNMRVKMRFTSSLSRVA